MMKRTKTTTRLGRRPTCLVGLLVLLALVTPSVAHAQLGRPTEAHDHDHEGRIFAGGALTYWRNTKERTTTFDFSPEIGYLFNDTWGTGLLLGYEHGSAGEGPARSVENAFKISPFVRCYYMHRGPFNLFMDGGAGVNFAEERKGGSVERRNGFEVGIRRWLCRSDRGTVPLPSLRFSRLPQWLLLRRRARPRARRLRYTLRSRRANDRAGAGVLTVSASVYRRERGYVQMNGHTPFFCAVGRSESGISARQ